MSSELLEKFGKKIEPHRNLWRSLRLVCFAVRHGERWLALGSRLCLSEALPTASNSLRPIDDFLAVSMDMPTSSLGRILHSILVDGVIPIESDSTTLNVHLSRQGAGLPNAQISQISWFPVMTHERRTNLWEYGTTRPAVTLTAWGERRHDVLDNDLLAELNSRLRGADSPYDGFSALFSEWMPGVECTENSQVPIQIVAPIPFHFEYAESGVVLVRGPAAPNVRLEVTTFYKACGTNKLQLTESALTKEDLAPGITTWEAVVPWPKNSRTAKIVLFVDGREIDSLEVTRWPSGPTLLAAINTFFDPEHKRLREALLERKPKDAFEFAVARLLNLLGLPVTWYGKIATDGRPDLLALIPQRTGPLVVLGECTRERPNAKFSGLAARSRELQKHLSNEVSVLPIVFTQALTTDSEIAEAVQHNVALIGYDQLCEILGFLDSETDTVAVLEFLRTMRSETLVVPHKIGLPPTR